MKKCEKFDNKVARSLSPSQLRFKQINSWYNHHYSNLYSKVVPNSLKDLEFKSKYIVRQRHVSRSPKMKDFLIENLHKNHIKSQNSCNIVVLPKSPFGQHKSYNNESNFSEEHFLFKEDSPKREFIQKQIGLLNKRIKRRYCNIIYTKKNTETDVDEFSTQSGKIFCVRPKPLIQLYEEDREKYKKMIPKIAESSLENTESKKETYFFQSAFKRLYGSPNKQDLYKKFDKIFESKFLKDS